MGRWPWDSLREFIAEKRVQRRQAWIDKRRDAIVADIQPGFEERICEIVDPLLSDPESVVAKTFETREAIAERKEPGEARENTIEGTIITEMANRSKRPRSLLESVRPVPPDLSSGVSVTRQPSAGDPRSLRRTA